MTNRLTLNGSRTSANKLEHTTLLLEVLAEVNSIMSQGKDFGWFCEQVGLILQNKLQYNYIHIWVRDEQDPLMLKLVTPETHNHFRKNSISHGVVGKSFREQRIICLPDVTQEPEYMNAHPETVSELCIPLIAEGATIGVLNIETDTLQTFQGQIHILQIIAENLSHILKVALLYNTEDQFHRLVEHMSEGVWVCDGDERTVYTNPALQAMLGYSGEELRGTVTYTYFDEVNKKIVKKENEKRVRGIGSHYEAQLVAKNGELVPVIIHAVPFDKGGSMATLTDVRALKNAEIKLQDRFEKMQEAYREMGLQRRHLDYLMEMIAMASSHRTTTKQIAHFLANAMMMMTKAKATTVRTMHHSSGKLVLQAKSGLGDEWLGRKTIKYEGSLIEAAVTSGKPFRVPNVESDARYSSPSLARKNNLRAALVIPLILRGEVMGSLTLYLAHEHNLELLDEEFIDIFAQEAAIAFKLVAKQLA